MLPLLDILQSIPVLGFMPGLILANWAQYGELFIFDSEEEKLLPYKPELPADL